MSIRVALVPLDERPVCTRLPSAVAALAGAAVEVPPVEVLPSVRAAGDVDATARWLVDVAGRADVAVVSLEGLGLGGLVPSRTGTEPESVVLGRWEVLRGLEVPVHASVVVPRAPDADDGYEEPRYWATEGRALHRLGAMLASGQDLTTSLATTGASPQNARDWLRRRMRQQALGLAAVGLAADGVLQTLVVGVDDADPASLSAGEAASLREWADRLRLDTVLVQPGTDETGAVLVARALACAAGVRPAVRVACATPDGLTRSAPYESVPVGVTAARQLMAAGAREDPDADTVLVVHAPDGAGDWAVDAPARTDTAAALATADLVVEALAAGVRVGVADVAQPNGADPALVAALAARGVLDRLTAWAAWNTAGNTLGTVAAALVASHAGAAAGTEDRSAARRLVASRLAEDWAWMTSRRNEVRARVGSDPLRHDVVPADDPALRGLARTLGADLAGLSGMGGWTVESVRLPWNRTFEIDLEVAPA